MKIYVLFLFNELLCKFQQVKSERKKILKNTSLVTVLVHSRHVFYVRSTKYNILVRIMRSPAD
jgi:hypothetical protein